MQGKIRKTKKHHNICNKLKPRRISNFKRALENLSSTNLDEYTGLLHNKRVASTTLKGHYDITQTNGGGNDFAMPNTLYIAN
jgi:hypothetical protein